MIHALRALKPSVKILATSGLTDRDNHAMLVAAGVDGIIEKPCEPAVLLTTIAIQLSKERSPFVISANTEEPLLV